MASGFCSSSRTTMLLLVFFFFFSLRHSPADSFEFLVGESKGWVVPLSNDSKVYNNWASGNRFQIGDSIRFRYKKDSVMEVTEEDYKRCNSTHPAFFSNTGNTVVKFNHSGPSYFISGVSGHCEKGQKMIVRVKTPDGSPPASQSSSAATAFGPANPVFAQLILFSIASVLFF